MEKVRKRTERLARSNGRTVTLLGGPMADWVVASDAPALEPSWGANSGYPGYRYATPTYDPAYSTMTARWERDGD